MKDKKSRDRFCHCISYGKIEPKKLEHLQTNRQRQMCVWRDIAPFSERQEEFLAASTRLSNTNSKPLFPPIYELPCITNYDTYKAMYNTGNSELSEGEMRSNNGRPGEENKATSQDYGCGSSALRDDDMGEEDHGFTKKEGKGSRNTSEPQSMRLKLPKLTNAGVVNQRLS